MQRGIKTFLLIMLLIGLLSPVRADSVEDRIDAYVNAQREKAHVPAISVAVVRDGKLVFAKGYGL